MCHGLLKQKWIHNLSKTSDLIVEAIYHEFVHGARKLCRQGQFWIKEGMDDQEHLRKPLTVKDEPFSILLQNEFY